jgi:seryl-tRNA synthetase
LLDQNNIDKINENVKLRKGVGDIFKAHELSNKLKDESLSVEERNQLEEDLHNELKSIPNQTHPAVKDIGDDPKIVEFYNEEPKFKHEPFEFSEICKKLNILRTDHLSNFSGHKTYYLMNDLAELVRNKLNIKINFSN